MDLVKELKKTRETISPCLPPFWARSGHLQTILGHLLPSPRLATEGEEFNVTLESERERIRTTYFKGRSTTAVYLFHGLGGSAEATYMQRTALLLQRLGHHIFLNNHRGCGQGAGLASEPYHSGRSDDLSKVIAFGRAKLPDHQHIAIGFSLSANALLLLAAGVGAETLPDAAIAVNGPINLDRASRKLQEGLNRIYDKRFTLELGRYMKANRPQDLGDYSLVKDLRDFDERYTAPLGGFRDRAHYYEACSARQHLGKIKIPTVVITACDDPFVSVEDYREAHFSEQCVVHLEAHGGHMGYLHKKGLGFERWLDNSLESYMKTLTSGDKVTP